MNQTSKRLLALVLACSLTLGLASPVWAAESTAEADAVSALTEETGSELTDPADLEDADDETRSGAESASASGSTDPADANASGDSSETPTDVDPMDTDPADTDPADSSSASDASTDGELVPESTPLELKYDDRYTFEKEGYVIKIKSITTDQVSSYQVSGGSKTSKKDTAVLTKSSDTEVIATGVGTATVTVTETKTDAIRSSSEEASDTLSTESTAADDSTGAQDAEALTAATEETSDSAETDSGSTDGESGQEESLDTESTVTYTVTVEPATLTIMFLAGQSNMEGLCGYYIYDHEHVVPCEPGTVYSSYGGKDAQTTRYVAGTKGAALDGDAGNASELLPGSLTSSTRKSVSGKTLYYPLNGLTSDCETRKTGMDAGLAYRWHELTGDKVWVINAAVSGTAIDRWDPKSTASSTSGKLYSRALKFYQQADKVLTAEIKAGHYTAGKRLMFWLQGEWDYNTSSSTYLKKFRNMAYGYKSSLKLDALGVITTRACVDKSNTVGATDLTMTGPRLAQYGLAYSLRSGSGYNDGFVYVVNNANEQWTTDSDVKNYFKSKYGSKLDYPTYYAASSNKLWYESIPTTQDEIKPDKHYTQMGHNENGVVAAEGMYQVLSSKGGTPSSVEWVNAKGAAMEKVTCGIDQSAIAVAETEPITSSKRVTFVADGTYCTYNSLYGTVTGKKAGKGWVKVVYNGKTLSTLPVYVVLPTPTLSSASNLSSGICITWKRVSGADGYQIWRRTGTGSWEKIADISGGATVTYADTSVKKKNGTFYTYTVRATNSAHAGWRSGYDATGLRIRRLTAVTLSKVSNSSGKKLNASWSANTKCSGYYLQYSTSSSFPSKSTGSVKISGSGTLKKTVSKLKKGKTYYIRVRCYQKSSGVTSYSAWSNTLKVKIKK